MKRLVVGAALFAAMPFCAQAQSPLQPGGFYITAEGGANWLLNSSFTSTLSVAPLFTGSTTTNASYNTGLVGGAKLLTIFLARVWKSEGVYRENTGSLTIGGLPGSAGVNFNEVSIMGNIYYDFFAGQSFVPYIGAGAGVAFMERRSRLDRQSTQFAYQGILGVGWNVDPTFRINLEGRYYGTTNSELRMGSAPGRNNNISVC